MNQLLLTHSQVDSYLPRLAGLIRDPHELVRRQVGCVEDLFIFALKCVCLTFFLACYSTT